MKMRTFGTICLSLLLSAPLWAKPPNKPDRGGGSTTTPMVTTHYAGYDIQPDTGVDTVYDSNTPGTTVTLDGTTYNMVQQCPEGSGTCTQAFDIYLVADSGNPADCAGDIGPINARMTLWVNDLLECGPIEEDPAVVCGDTYSSTARAQIRELDGAGGVLAGGFGVELNWDSSLGGADVDITAYEGSWVVVGAYAVTISGRGRNKTVCGYDASFSLTTEPAPAP